MSSASQEFNRILKQTVKITRRSGFTTSDMGMRIPSGETVIAANASVFFDMPKANYRMTEAGNFKVADYVMFAKVTEDVQEGDLLYPQTVVVGLTLGTVLEVKPSYDFDGGTHHIEVAVKRVS